MRRLVCNPTIQYIIINLHTKYDYSSLHSFTEIFDKNFSIQNMERKKIGQIQGRISRRRLVYNHSIQHVVINLYTKYDFSSLQGCGEKVLRNYGRTDGRKDGITDRCKPVYPPLFQSKGIISKETSGTGRIKTQSLSQTSKGKMEKCVNKQ